MQSRSPEWLFELDDTERLKSLKVGTEYTLRRPPCPRVLQEDLLFAYT